MEHILSQPCLNNLRRISDDRKSSLKRELDKLYVSRGQAQGDNLVLLKSHEDAKERRTFVGSVVHKSIKDSINTVMLIGFSETLGNLQCEELKTIIRDRKLLLKELRSKRKILATRCFMQGMLHSNVEKSLYSNANVNIAIFSSFCKQNNINFNC